MTQSWISGLPGYENVCFVHVRGSTLATKGHYTFSLLRYPEVKDPSHPFPGRSILDLGFTCLEGHTFYYSYTGFKASMAHEVGATPLMETIRSLLETHKGSSTTYDLFNLSNFYFDTCLYERHPLHSRHGGSAVGVCLCVFGDACHVPHTPF